MTMENSLGSLKFQVGYKGQPTLTPREEEQLECLLGSSLPSKRETLLQSLELKGLTAKIHIGPPSEASPPTQGKEKGWSQATFPLLRRCSPLHRAGMAPRAWLPTDRSHQPVSL